jgi:hypothetical protein
MNKNKNLSFYQLPLSSGQSEKSIMLYKLKLI